MPASVVRILDGNTFVVSDERGDIEASTTDPTGLFSYDTRFLSTWVLTVDGIRLTALSTDDLQYFEARFFLVPATGTVYIDPKLSVIRERAVGDGFHETLTILSHAGEPVELSALEFKLLRYFVEHRGATLSRDELLNEVWGYDAMPSTRTVDVHVAWLRQKLEPNPRIPQYILTIHGLGYKFAG